VGRQEIKRLWLWLIAACYVILFGAWLVAVIVPSSWVTWAW
jgi:hypothetical protein